MDWNKELAIAQRDVAEWPAWMRREAGLEETMLPSEIQHEVAKARREQMERDCRAVCMLCAEECPPVERAGAWWHDDKRFVGPNRCTANAIRKAFEEQR